MIISVSPPSSISLRSIEKKTRSFFGESHSVKRNIHGLLAIGDKYMVLVKNGEILLSFSDNDSNAVSFLRTYLTCLFRDVFIGVDMDNPVTQNLSFVINLP